VCGELLGIWLLLFADCNICVLDEPIVQVLGQGGLRLLRAVVDRERLGLLVVISPFVHTV